MFANVPREAVIIFAVVLAIAFVMANGWIGTRLAAKHEGFSNAGSGSGSVKAKDTEEDALLKSVKKGEIERADIDKLVKAKKITQDTLNNWIAKLNMGTPEDAAPAEVPSGSASGSSAAPAGSGSGSAMAEGSGSGSGSAMTEGSGSGSAMAEASGSGSVMEGFSSSGSGSMKSGSGSGSMSGGSAADKRKVAQSAPFMPKNTPAAAPKTVGGDKERPALALFRKLFGDD